MFSTVCSYNTRGDVFVYFKYFKLPLINASSINTCEKKQKQQQKKNVSRQSRKNSEWKDV